MSNPLIITAMLDNVAQQQFDEMRRAHFPPERNYLSAHVTLFHAIPGEHEAFVRSALIEVALRPPIGAEVSEIILMGGGVAYRLVSPAMLSLRRELAQLWQPWLTRQDGLKSDLHVTVQNKVDPNVARRLRDSLSQSFVPYPVTFTGIALWRYQGGPWQALDQFSFIDNFVSPTGVP